MINIISDLTLLLRSSQKKHISTIKEYSVGYMNILEALNAHEDYSVVVQTEVIVQWLKKMAARYPQGTFLFESIDARSALTQRWNIDIPIRVTNEDILQTGLLTSDLRPQPGFSFEDTLLAHYYAPILTSRTFPFTQISPLLEAVDHKQWKANLGIPLLARTLHSRLEEWKSKARSSEQRQLVEL
ncbi:MAG: hypothetical protein GYA55_05690, partial [SAR324 cluster bacterium]|nr:hypothetical protein [SAR324 cluster bacterium]